MTKDHFVPQFYLNSFALGDEKVLWYADLRRQWVRRTTPKRFAAAKDFYSLEEAAVLRTLEPIYSGYETRAAPIFKLIAHTDHPETITNEEQLRFLHFIVLQMLRTPSGHSALAPHLQGFMARALVNRPAIQAALALLPSSEQLNLSSLILAGALSSRPEPTLIKLIAITAAINLAAHIASVPSDWFFVPADNENEYITSDSPAIFIEPMYGGSVGHIAMPLSPRRLLVVCRNEYCDERHLHSMPTSFANRIIAEDAYEQIYARSRPDADEAFRHLTSKYRFTSRAVRT